MGNYPFSFVKAQSNMWRGTSNEGFITTFHRIDKEKWTVIKDEKDCIKEDCVKKDCIKKDCIKKDCVKEDCVEEDYVELECPVDLAFENIMQGFVNIL